MAPAIGPVEEYLDNRSSVVAFGGSFDPFHPASNIGRCDVAELLLAECEIPIEDARIVVHGARFVLCFAVGKEGLLCSVPMDRLRPMFAEHILGQDALRFVAGLGKRQDIGVVPADGHELPLLAHLHDEALSAALRNAASEAPQRSIPDGLLPAIGGREVAN